jgi:hypothetical protein
MGNKKVLSKATRELNKTKRFAAPKNIIVDPKGQWAHPGEITRIPSDTITMQGVPYPVMAYPNIGEPQMMYPGGEYYYPGADYVDEYPQMQDGGAIPVIEDAGSYSAEGYWIPDWEAMKKQAKELNAKTVKTKSGSIIYFDSNWDVQNVDDNPQMKRGGTPKSLVKMPKPSKKGLASKKFSRSLEATNKLFTENYLFAKPKSRKRKVFDPNAADYQEGGEAGCPPGYAYNPVTGECIEWNPTVWSSEEQSTSYDPVGDVIYMNPNDRPEGMSDEEYQQMYQDQLEHEQLHRLQWLNGDLKGQSGTPLRMPSTVDNQDYEGEHYYDRRGQEEAYLHNLWNQQNPDLARFIPSNVVYNKEINPVMYELPWTTEGEARGYEDALHSGMESFFPKKQEGGDPGKGFKKRLMKRYPGMQGIYGPEGENLNIVKDPNYDAASEPYNAGNIEFMFPGLPQVSYPNKKDETLPDYVYVNPSPDKYTSVYNPRGANRGDIFLDMLHGMRDDQNYEVLLQNFDKAVRDARGEDMQYFYEQAVANEGYTDSQEQYNDNYVDSQLRAQLAPGTLGMFSHGRKDYRMERKYDSPEMKAAAKEIKKYLKTPKEDYVETELTPEEIEEYRKGGFIVEDISVPSLTMQKGGDPDPKKKKTSRIEPFITSDPDEYAFRKAAYDDSLHAANKYNSKQPRTSKYTLYKGIVGKSFPGKRASVKREYIPYIPRTLDTYDVSGESPAWEKFRRENMHLRDRMIENQPIGFVTEKSVYDSRAIRTPFGVKTFTLPGEHQAKEFDRKPRYKRPVQPVIFKEPVTHQEKKKPVEHKYPTSRKPVVDNTKQKPPEGKIVVGKEEVQQLDPNTGVVTTVINPVYEDAMMPIQTLPPARVNHTLQKFIGEPLPVTVQEEIPEEELLDEEIPEEEIPEEEMYGEEEVDGEYVDAGRKRLFPNIYVDTHGRKLKYTTYRLRKHGHSGDLIKKKGVDYMYFPKIERGPSTHFWMDYKQEGGAAASPFDLDPEHMKRYLADLRKQENSIRKGYKNGMWYPHASLEGGADTIAYGHKLTPNDSALRRGITEEQALKLQEQDVLKNQALAKKQVDKQFGTGTFDNLPQDSQMLLVDYQYNLGTLSGFPKFVKGVVEGNKEQMLAQHTRYGAGKPLTKRNEWTVDVINNMEIPKPYDPMGQITIPLANVPDATNVVQPVILEGPKEAIELELTPEEIKEYARGGFIVEDVSVPTLTQAQEGGSPDPKTNFYTVEGSDGVYRKVNGKWEVDWNRSGKFQPLSKGDVKERSAILNKKAKPLYDATYDDLYATQRSAYTATPKPTPAKKPTPQNKAAQEKFDKTFAVTDKSKMEVVEDKVQKGIDDFAKYHQEQTGKPLTQEEYNDAYKDIYNRAYVNAGVYKPTMSGPTINPYGTTKERKNLVSLDPGNAPKNLTLGDYVEKGWDVITNPLDYASYALKPKGTVATPWNMTNYENRLAAAGLEDPVTANNNVNKALDFASWFIGPGMVAQGLKMVPSTVNSIGRAFKDPSWENTRDALFDTGMTALSIVPGFGIAKNLAKPASTIDDLRAIEALRGNTATTPFQSYYLTGDRALGASEAAAQQSQALRKFIEPQSLQLPAGRSPIMSESIRTQLTNPAVDSYFPVRFGDDAYTAAGKEYYSVDPEDYRIFNPETQQYEYNPNWRQEGLQDATESLDNTLSNLPSFSSESTKGLGSWEFGQFTPGWEALQEAKGFTMRGPKMPKKTDYYSDREFQDLLMNEMRYNIAKDEQKIQEALTGKKFTDEDFESISGALKPSNFRDKYLTPEQEKYVRQILVDNESVKSNPLLKENLEAILARSERIANPSAKNKPFRPGDIPMSLNAVPETPKSSSRLPRGTAQQTVLSDLESLRKQTIMGQDEAFLTFNDLQEQKLKDLNTPEGRRRIQEFIDDNNLRGSYDEGNYFQLADEYVTKLPEIIKNSDANEINSIIERVKNYQNDRGFMGTRSAKNSGLGSWDELTAADLERVVNPTGINDMILKQTISGSLAKTDPRNTEGFTKLTVDDYIQRIEETKYDDMFLQISGEEMRVKNIEKSLKDKVNERNQLRREYDAGNISQADYKKTQRVLNQDVLDLELQLKNAEASLKSSTQYLNRSNANADLEENSINIGNLYTSIGNLQPTMYHEFGHITEGSFIPLGSNSAIDRDLITNIDFLDEAPEYLFQSINPDKVLSETAPYNLTRQGIEKYKDPDEYFNSSKEYFLEGGNGHSSTSMEPAAFAVELRPALKRIGLIKNDFDKVTPEMLEKLYEAYTSNPEFKFLDLRIFDIMKPTEKSFKTLSKNLNKIKGIAPYAIPVGLGVGATGLAGQEEIQEDMEYQDGGILMELSDSEIEEYKNGGWIVEEL